MFGAAPDNIAAKFNFGALPGSSAPRQMNLFCVALERVSFGTIAWRKQNNQIRIVRGFAFLRACNAFLFTCLSILVDNNNFPEFADRATNKSSTFPYHLPLATLSPF